MTKAEVEILDSMLEDLDNYYGNAGCNDLNLKDTEQNRRIVQLAFEDLGQESDMIIDGTWIMTTDFVILKYLRKRLRGDR